MVLLDKTDWDMPGSFESIMDFTRAWLRECWRVLSMDGAIWVSGTQDPEWVCKCSTWI